jgi:DNA-directed RNA polymerase specialized sigma24 family protein
MASEVIHKKSMPKHRILREIFRHYTELKAFVTAYGGDSLISHSYIVYDEDGEAVGKEDIDISFWDLHDALNVLSDRKREAVYYNVILDWKQKDVAEKMQITTVSVGQYVEQAVLQLAKHYWPEDYEQTELEEKTDAKMKRRR